LRRREAVTNCTSKLQSMIGLFFYHSGVIFAMIDVGDEDFSMPSSSRGEGCNLTLQKTQSFSLDVIDES